MSDTDNQYRVLKDATDNTSMEEIGIITRIVERASQYAEKRGIEVPQYLQLDIIVAHRNCRLDLSGLLMASDFEFVHDIWGIHRELDRNTGRLGLFLPRYAV